MKKIVFLEQNLNGGGAERVTCSLLRALVKHEQYEVHLVLTGNLGSLSHLVPSSVIVHELGFRHSRSSFLKLARALRFIRPSAVYSSFPRLVVMLVLLRWATSNFKIIGRYPSMPSLEMKEYCYSRWHFIFYKIFLKKIEIMIAQTKEMKDELINYYGFLEQQVVIVINPVDVSYIDDCLVNAENPYERGIINIVASGRIKHEKGFDILLEAFAKIACKNNSVHLHILGRDCGNNQQLLESRAKVNGINEQLHFYGFIKNPYPYYKYCDLFVLSSRREGLPNVVLECNYLGTPVVATRCVPVVERLVYDGKNGFVVNVEDIEGLSVAIQKAMRLPRSRPKVTNSLTKFLKLLG